MLSGMNKPESPAERPPPDDPTEQEQALRDDLPSRFGRAMLFGAWIVGFALLFLFFDGWIKDQDDPNRDLTVAPGAAAEVVLKQNRHGHYVAPGTINGEPVVFLLDTGATAVALPLPLAKRLGLPLRRGGMASTANGEVQVWTTVLKEVALGGLSARHVRASVMPNMSGNEVLLGMSWLRRFEMVQQGHTLTLRRQD